MSEIVTTLSHALQSDDTPDQLLENLQLLLNSLPFPIQDLSPILSSFDSIPLPSTHQHVAQLLKLELILYFSCGLSEEICAAARPLLKQLSWLAFTNQANRGASPLATAKYHDLQTDFHFLVSRSSRDLQLVDLVSKKTAALQADVQPGAVRTQIRLKCLVYYLLCEHDHRRASIKKFLENESVLSDLCDDHIRDYAALESRLVSIHQFRDFTAHLTQYYAFHSVMKSHSSQFLVNYLDLNISKLPSLFDSISLGRIRDLFLEPSSTVDVEDVVYKMIISKKFTVKTSIDQVTNYVHFEEKSQKYDAFQSHIKKVCDVIDTLAQDA